MPDITMCDNKKCPIKETCYRFTAIPSEYRQSYFMDDIRETDGSCDYFIDNSKFKLQREDKEGTD